MEGISKRALFFILHLADIKTTRLSDASTVFTPSFWPTSITKAKLAEKQLLQAYGDLDENSFSIENIAVKDKENPTITHEINTLKILPVAFTPSSADKNRNVLFCHGFGGGLGFFYRNYKNISQSLNQCNLDNNRKTGFNLFSIDWLGMGTSSRPKYPTSSKEHDSHHEESLDFFLNPLEAWRQKMNIDSFTFVAHSLGGLLSVHYALKYPERVEKLILLSPVGIPSKPGANLPSDPGIEVAVTGHKMPSWFSYVWRNNYTPQWFLRMLGPLGPRLARGYVDARFRAHSTDEERLALAMYFYHISAGNGSGEYSLSSFLDPGAWAKVPLGNLLLETKLIERLPIVFIYGEHDWMDYRHAEALSGAKVRIIPQSDHHMYFDNPKVFNEIITEEILSTV